MKTLFWNIAASVLSRPFISKWLIAYAQRAPYFHLDGYMERWWVFNPYDHESRKTKWPFSRSIRVHHILRPDSSRDPHDHPWDARTIILKGWYVESRDDGLHNRMTGDTAAIGSDEFHNIVDVSPGGVYTLFITGDYKHRWGFRVDGAKVPHTEYVETLPK